MTDRVASAGPVRRLVIGLAGIAWLGGCGSILSEKDAATDLVDRYYATLAGGSVADALAFYGESFYARTPRARWAATLEDLQQRCGVPRAHALFGWHVTTRRGKDPGTTAQLEYHVEYEHCRTTEEIVVTTTEAGVRAITAHTLEPVDGPVPSTPDTPNGAVST